MFDDRAERKRRQKSQRADENDRADKQQDEREAAHGKVPALAGTIFFFANEPASASSGMIMPKRPSSMSMPSVVSYHRRIGIEAGKGAAVVARAGSIGVKHFAQAMRALICPGSEVPQLLTDAHAVNPRMMNARITNASSTIFTS